LAVRIDQAGIEQKNPSIAQGIRAGHSTFDAPTGGLRIESRYGDSYLVDGDRFTASPLPASTSSAARHGAPDDELNVALPDGGFLDFRNDPRGGAAHLERVNAAHNEYTPIQPDLTYVSPLFVVDTCAHVVTTLDGTYFVVWKKVRGDFVTSVLSRIRATGARVWSTDLQASEPQNGRVVGAADGLLVVVMKHPADYVVALDAKTGEQRWRYDL
jgi:hypothetical protein